MKDRERNDVKTKFIADCLIDFEVILRVIPDIIWPHVYVESSRDPEGDGRMVEHGYSSLLKKNHPFLNVRTKYLLCRQGPCSSELRNSYLTPLARLDISTYSCWLKSGYTHLSQKRAHIASLTANEGDVTSKPFVLLNQIQVISYIEL